MIKFEHIPPRTPEDVNLTDSAIQEIKRKEDFNDDRLKTMGITLGQVIVSNCDNPEAGLLLGIIERFNNQLDVSPVSFLAGLDMGMTLELVYQKEPKDV